MSWEEKYYEDILPEIQRYAEEEASSFTSRDISERLEGYSSSEVGKTLKYVVENDLTDHVLMTGNHPKSWEAVLLDGKAWELAEYGMDVEPAEPQEEDVEEEEKKFSPPEEIRWMSSRIRDSGLEPGLAELSEPEYGRLRRNIGDVYPALEEVRESDSLFGAGDLDDRVEGVRPAEIGLVLSGLESAGLLESYGDRNLYRPDSVDMDRIDSFMEVLERADSLEEIEGYLDGTGENN
ncbi:MAG: hypothetical protein ABEK01_04035 [Candidatus Nanohaloarchaea archaeon]